MSRPASPDISVVIPVYNRGEIIRYTLESVRRAAEGLSVEVIVVDDGSSPPAAESIARLGYAPEKILRQSNQGLLFARLTGLAAATGRHVLFLDSDDLISREKLRRQITAMEAAQADVSYTDTAQCLLQGDYDALSITPDAPCLDTRDSAEFFISVQPAPDGMRILVIQAPANAPTEVLLFPMSAEYAEGLGKQLTAPHIVTAGSNGHGPPPPMKG